MSGPYKNVVVVGGSFVGLMAAHELVKTLPEGYRVVVVEKNSHFAHLFAYPRFAILPAHEHKAFIPFKPMLRSPHAIVRAKAVSITPSGSLELDHPVDLVSSSSESTSPVSSLPYEALVIATGTQLSPPGTMPGRGDKQEGVAYLRSVQRNVQDAKEVVILGGGAVGVQMACDLAVLSPGKSITLVHSRDQLMPRFHPRLSEIVKARFAELGIKTVLGSRARVPNGGFEGWRGGAIELENGDRVPADYIIQSTGQTPNSQFLQGVAPSAILPSGFVSVNTFSQVAPTVASELNALDGRVFAIGDIAETGAQKAARPAMQHAQVLGRNVAKLLNGEPSTAFEEIEVSPGAIHLTLGFVESIVFRNPRRDPSTGGWFGDPVVTMKVDGKDDMGIEGVWERRVPGFVKRAQDYHL
ncbi:hypothetical protein JCM10212_001568 [Sporobolomyces blumeae]